MAIVAEYKLKNCTVLIHDDAYAGISKEENARRIREAQRVAWGIWDRAQLRKKAKEEAENGGELSGVPVPEQ